MKRNEWTWEKQAAEIAVAAEKRRDYHAGRLQFWETEKSDVVELIQASGLDIREHQQTGGARHEVVIDPTLSRRLSECEAKIQGHQAQVEEYARWVEVLDAEPTRSFTLDHSDYIFFFGQAATE